MTFGSTYASGIALSDIFPHPDDLFLRIFLFFMSFWAWLFVFRRVFWGLAKDRAQRGKPRVAVPLLWVAGITLLGFLFTRMDDIRDGLVVTSALGGVSSSSR